MNDSPTCQIRRAKNIFQIECQLPFTNGGSLEHYLQNDSEAVFPNPLLAPTGDRTGITEQDLAWIRVCGGLHKSTVIYLP